MNDLNNAALSELRKQVEHLVENPAILPALDAAIAALQSKASAPVADELPHWDEISAKMKRGEELTPLELFVYDNEPAGDEDIWRDQLAAALASAPVAGEAQPTDAEIIDLAVEPLGIDCDRMPHGVVVFARNLLSRYAAPQASEAVRDADHPVFAFLLGEGPLRGVHFGERAPGAIGKWWWRQELRAALSAQPGAQKEQSDA